MQRWQHFFVCVSIALLGCCESTTEPRAVDTGVRRRVFRPPPKGEVRAIPPHNIHSKGVGPYELGASFQTTLALLPHGPRVELYKAKGLFDYRLMRAEADALVIGVGRRGGVAFVSVLDPDIAKTESGVGVGAGVSELVGALGEIQPPTSGGRDARIISFAALPNARFIVNSEKVVAALILPPTEKTDESSKGGKGGEGSKKAPSVAEAKPVCLASELQVRRAEIVATARLRESDVDEMLFVCMLSNDGEAVVTAGEQVVIVSKALSGGLRRVGATNIPGLDFVAVLDMDRERPQLFSISQRRTRDLREVLVAHYPLNNGKLSVGWTGTAYSLRAEEASWIGSNWRSAEFLIELGAGNGGVVVGGIYMQGQGGVLRHVVPVTPITLPVEYPDSPMKKPSSSTAGIDAGRVDAGARDSGS